MNSNVLEELINAQNNNQSAFGNLLPLVPFTYFQSSPLTNFSDDIFMKFLVSFIQDLQIYLNLQMFLYVVHLVFYL